MGLIKRERGGRGRGDGRGSSICAWNYKSFKGINLTVLEIMHQCIMYIL